MHKNSNDHRWIGLLTVGFTTLTAIYHGITIPFIVFTMVMGLGSPGSSDATFIAGIIAALLLPVSFIIAAVIAWRFFLQKRYMQTTFAFCAPAIGYVSLFIMYTLKIIQ